MKKLLIGITILASMSSFAEDGIIDHAVEVFQGLSNFSSVEGVVHTEPDYAPEIIVTGNTAETIWNAALDNGISPVKYPSGKLKLVFKGWVCKQLNYGIESDYDIMRILHSEIDGSLMCKKDLY